MEKLVGARKRKGNTTVKIPQRKEELTSLSKILQELKQKKTQINLVKPLTPPLQSFHQSSFPQQPERGELQTEPLDLSVQGVDLTKNISIDPMAAFYHQYFVNSPKHEDGMSSIGLGVMATEADNKREQSTKLVCMALPRKQESVVFKNKEKKINKPKQRRYRTERPFACPHCPARFTLRSNMERHGKHQHAIIWQRSPSNRVLNKQKLLHDTPLPPTHHDNAIKQQLGTKIRKKVNEEICGELASVDRLLQLEGPLLGRRMEDIDMDDMEEDEEEDEEEEEEEEEEDVEEEKRERKTSAYSSAPHKICCPHCTRRFPWTSSLRRHLLTHTGQKPYQCSKCPLLFTTKSNCDRHLVRKHKQGQGPQEESEDPEDSEEEGLIVDHGEAPNFRCHICEQIASPSRSEILIHMETSHPTIFEEFKEKNLIQEFEEEIQLEHGNRKVLCAFCLRRFWSVEDLRRHIRSHTGERPFSCKFCERKFTLKHSMMRHLKKH